MNAFNYRTEGELFPGKSQRYKSRHPMYLRFASAAEAVRYAIEVLPPELLPGSQLEVDEERFGRDGIRRLYDSSDYPLTRPSMPDFQ